MSWSWAIHRLTRIGACIGVALLVIAGGDVAIARADAGEPGPLALPHELDDEDGPITRAGMEKVLGRQPALIGRALALLEPERASHRDLYLIGFAGFGRQHVFRHEVEAVDELLGERFGTRGRSLELINSPDTVDHVPLAAPDNLDVALQRLGHIMDPSEDVLVLFLTSHGTPGRFAVAMDELSLRDLTPGQLRGMLDRSGIRNRVIIISACYAGSFVDALKGDNTLLMTAASADRTSFGCADKRDWTYFGDALFNHALRHAASFSEGFDMARQLVAEWEQRDGSRPSEPQISIGRNIEAILKDLPVGPPQTHTRGHTR